MVPRPLNVFKNTMNATILVILTTDKKQNRPKFARDIQNFKRPKY